DGRRGRRLGGGERSRPLRIPGRAVAFPSASPPVVHPARPAGRPYESALDADIVTACLDVAPRRPRTAGAHPLVPFPRRTARHGGGGRPGLARPGRTRRRAPRDAPRPGRGPRRALARAARPPPPRRRGPPVRRSRKPARRGV